MLKILNLCLVLILLCGCATTEYSGRSRLMLMDDAEIKELGKESREYFLNSEPIDTSSNRAILIKNIGQRLIKTLPPNDYNWNFYYVPKNTVNAFALIDGDIFVYDGIFEVVKNEGQLAAIVGHEIAHVVAKHIAEQQSKDSIAQIGIGILGIGTAIGTGSAETAQSVMELSSAAYMYGVSLPFSREHEYEADSIGTIIMSEAGYNPEFATDLWQSMIDYKNKLGVSSSSDFTSTHPIDEKRMQAIKLLESTTYAAYQSSRTKYNGNNPIPKAQVKIYDAKYTKNPTKQGTQQKSLNRQKQ